MAALLQVNGSRPILAPGAAVKFSPTGGVATGGEEM